MLREKLKQYFTNLEANIAPLDEFELGKKIGEIIKEKEEKITDPHELAEFMAFQFLPDYPSKEASWGTYYGPMYVLPNQQGQFVEFPSIKLVDNEMITYWRDRANTSKQPILACRYADLVTDFEPKIKNGAFDYQMAQKVIDSSITICEKDLDDALGCKTKLKRALTLAKQINDKSRLQQLQDLIFVTEKKFATDDKPGLWGNAFEWLLLDKSGKIVLGSTQTNALITDMEDRLERLSDITNPNPWPVEHGVELLAEYYAQINDEAKLKSVLDKLEKAFRTNEHSNSDGLLIVNYLEKLSEIYLKYSQFEFAKQASTRVKAELGNLGDRGKFDTHEISTEIKIDNEDIKKFIDSIFGAERKEEIDKIATKLAVNFIPKKNQIEKQLKDISQKFIFQHIATQTIISEDGFPIAKIGPIDENYNDHLLKQFAQNLHFQSPFLRWTFEELRKHHTPEALYKIWGISPVFRAEDKDYILKTLKFFWDKEYLAANSLFIPLIEDAVRNVYRINGISFLKKNDNVGYDVESLQKLLHRGVIKKVFQSLGENTEYYFQVLLTERIGWNLRNNLAHGINKSSYDDEDIANRLLHVLLCLSLIRQQDNS